MIERHIKDGSRVDPANVNDKCGYGENTSTAHGEEPEARKANRKTDITDKITYQDPIIEYK